MSRWIYSFGLLLLVHTGVAGAATEWRMDPHASELLFQVSYQGEPAPGSFAKFDTQMHFDPAHPADGRLRVTVKLASIDMGSDDLNAAVRGPEWFDMHKFSQAEFSSSGFKRIAAGRYVATGTLQLKGMKRAVEVPFSWKPDGQAAMMRGELALDRTAFGIGTGDWATGDPIGLSVMVRFNVRLVPAG